MSIEAKTLSTFEDIKEPYTQAYNRLQVAFNFNEQGKRDQAEYYLNRLTNKGRVFVALVATDIKRLGLHEVKKKVRGLIDDEGVLANES